MAPSRVEYESSQPIFTPQSAAAAIAAIVPDDELETPPLPREHPKWVKDALLVSHRAKQLLDRIRPIAMHVLTFWDHAVRAITVGNRRITVDPSGSYRVGE